MLNVPTFDTQYDFDHQRLAQGHALRRHWLYRLGRGIPALRSWSESSRGRPQLQPWALEPIDVPAVEYVLAVAHVPHTV